MVKNYYNISDFFILLRPNFLFSKGDITSTENAYVRCLKSIYIPSLLTMNFYIYLYNGAHYLFFIYIYLICYFSSRCKLKSTWMVHKSFRFCLYNSKVVANSIENCGHYIFLVDHIFKNKIWITSAPQKKRIGTPVNISGGQQRFILKHIM